MKSLPVNSRKHNDRVTIFTDLPVNLLIFGLRPDLLIFQGITDFSEKRRFSAF